MDNGQPYTRRISRCCFLGLTYILIRCSFVDSRQSSIPQNPFVSGKAQNDNTASMSSATSTTALPLAAGTIKAVVFDLDGTLLDTEALSDKANLKNFEGLLPPGVEEEIKQIDGRLPWEIKKQILGLRASSWVPLLTNYAQEKWGVTTPLSVYVSRASC